MIPTTHMVVWQIKYVILQQDFNVFKDDVTSQ